MTNQMPDSKRHGLPEAVIGGHAEMSLSLTFFEDGDRFA